MHSDSKFLRHIVFSVECVYHISEIANNQNASFWWSSNPRLIQEHQRHSENITVWYESHSNGALEPYYFDKETARGEDYHYLLNTYVWNSKHLFPPNSLFQQDGAPAHTSNLDRPLLQELFPISWIVKYGPYHWLARSPDLTPPDFFLWGFIKDEVLETPVTNITQLKEE